ncbi:Ras-related protein Rab-33 [Trichinella zimbabwensis]|uniref:Ras-related protein Rab-33 n=1 Tax=Trichinella zimbabwensis TaxID=268475 RepID=A0A0V1I3A3_9BILA|nr:Ras-related protein Rab-33 [Trichinella zimbabwensis]
MTYMSFLQASDPNKDCDKTEKMLKESEKADPYQALQQICVVAHNRRRTFKVIVLGDPGVGKTCLTFRFCNGRFPSNSTPTIGVDFREKVIDLDGETLRVQFWDTAGQERFQQSMIAHYYRNISSFRNLIRWIEECQKHNIFGTVPMILIGNKCDLESVVTTEEAQIFADKHDMPLFLTSAQDDLELNHVESIFMTLAHILQKNKSLHVTTDEERAAFPFDVQKLRNDVIERLEKYQNSYPKFRTLIIRSLTPDYPKSFWPAGWNALFMNIKFNLRFINTLKFCGFRIFMSEQKLEMSKRMDNGESFRKIARNFDICRGRCQLNNFVSHMDTSSSCS